MMVRAAAIALLAIGLASCDMVNTMTDGFRHTKDVENELASSTGLPFSAAVPMTR